MANVLRELVARVVLRVDESTLQRLDEKLTAAREKLEEVQSKGQEGIKVAFDSSEAERSLIGIRVALSNLGDDLSPEIAADLRDQLEEGRAKADELRASIDLLRLSPGTTDEVRRLSQELAGIEREATRTAAALDEVGNRFQNTAEERSLIGIRVALRDLGAGVSPEIAGKLREQFEASKAKAEELRATIDRLRLSPDTAEDVARLERELGGLERESVKTAAALDKVDAQLRDVADEARKLPGIFGVIQSRWSSLSGLAKTVGFGLSAAAIGTWVQGTLNAADALGAMAGRLGTTTDEMQVWQAFAREAGASNEDLSASFRSVANQIEAVKRGDASAKSAFKELNIDTSNWKREAPALGDTLALIGGRLAELDDEGKRVALTQRLLSEGGLKLAPGFKGGTEAVQQQIDRLKQLAIVYDEEFISNAAGANAEMALFKDQFAGLGSEIILTFLPALRGVVRGLTPIVRSLREAFEHSSIFKGILAATGITALASFGGIGSVLTRMAPMLQRLALMAAPFLWAFAKFAILALIFDDLWVALNGGKSVIGEVLGKFAAGKEILEGLQATFKLLKGSVLMLWGALTGDQESIDQGKALIDEFSLWADNAFARISDAWSEFWTVTFPTLVDEGLDVVDASLSEALGEFYDDIKDWAGRAADVVTGLWDTIVDSLGDMLSKVGKMLSNIPGFGFLDPDAPPPDVSDWEPVSPGAKQRKAEMMAERNRALYAGLNSNPFLPGSGNSTSVNVTYHQDFKTTIETKNERETLAAVYRTEQAYVTAAKDNKRTLRHTVGASR